MTRTILIFAAAWLFLAPFQASADETQYAGQSLSDEQMADLVEQAAEGKLTLSNEMLHNVTTREQWEFLTDIINARLYQGPITSGSDGNLTYRAIVDDNQYYQAVVGARRFWHAVAAARAGDTSTADVQLELSWETFPDWKGRGLYVVLYRRWNGWALSYRFLRWWAKYVFPGSLPLGMAALIVAVQILTLPLLLKLQKAIKTGRRGRALLWPALAAGFAEFTPLCWAAANGPAWAFAYETHDPFFHGQAVVLDIVIVLVFAICSNEVFSSKARIGLGVVLLLFGGGLTFLPFAFLRDHGLVSEAGSTVGAAFWSGTIAVVIYFLLLLRRERLFGRTI